MADYRGSKGGAYNTTYTGPTPLELFDAGRWAECLHACAFMLFTLKDAGRAWDALDDEGLLHELVHLVCGVRISLNNRHENIRAEVALLWGDFCAATQS